MNCVTVPMAEAMLLQHLKYFQSRSVPFDPTSSNCIVKHGLLRIASSYSLASFASQHLKIEITSALSLVPLLEDEKSIDLEDVRDEKKTESITLHMVLRNEMEMDYSAVVLPLLSE
jgi:hypothetical protein